MGNSELDIHDDYVIEFHWASRLQRPLTKESIIVGEHAITRITGILAQASETLESIDNIESIAVYKSVKQRLMGAGDLKLTMHSSATREFNNIANPDEAARVIRSRMAYWRDGTQLERLARYMRSGDAHLEDKEYDKAMVSFEAALRIDPKDRLANMALGETLRFMKQYDRAIDVLNGCLNEHPQSYGTLVDLAVTYSNRARTHDRYGGNSDRGWEKWNKDNKTAFEYWHRVIEKCPEEHKDRFQYCLIAEMATYGNSCSDKYLLESMIMAADLWGRITDNEIVEELFGLIVRMWGDNPGLRAQLPNPQNLGAPGGNNDSKSNHQPRP